MNSYSHEAVEDNGKMVRVNSSQSSHAMARGVATESLEDLRQRKDALANRRRQIDVRLAVLNSNFVGGKFLPDDQYRTIVQEQLDLKREAADSEAEIKQIKSVIHEMAIQPTPSQIEKSKFGERVARMEKKLDMILELLTKK